MADSKPEPGAGNVAIMLAGKEHQMVPTLEACMSISKFAGGAAAAIKRCWSLDFDAICEVISIGTGYTSLNQRKMIQEAVFETGTIPVAADCVLFIRIVNNGGRVPDDDDEGGEVDAADPLTESQSASSIAA